MVVLQNWRGALAHASPAMIDAMLAGR